MSLSPPLSQSPSRSPSLIDDLPRVVVPGPTSAGVAPQFYGGPIPLPDGSLLGTVGLYWSADDPLSPTPDGPYHRMSIVAIRSTDGFNWEYHGVVANASGPGGYPTSAFGPDENDVALLEDGKTLLCVIRMDGDSGCSTNSYRYYAAIYSHDMGKTWTRAVRYDLAMCAPCATRPCAGTVAFFSSAVGSFSMLYALPDGL
eukprot:COSAG03_NODE_462_length_7701_cov_5.645883_5_plen_200_part_00